MGQCEGADKGHLSCSWLFCPEESIRRRHMGCGLVAMRGNPGDFGFKLGDAQIELIPRIAVQAFAA